MNLDTVDVVIQDTLVFMNTVYRSIRIMEDHAGFVKDIAPLRQEIVGLLDPDVRTLDSLAVLTEVVIIDFSVILNHFDKARVFHDLAVMNPVGIRAHIMQAGLIAQEHAGAAVKYKGRLMGTVLRSGHVQVLDDVALLIEIVGVSVNGGPLALVRLLALHIVGGADGIGEPAAPALPLGVEGNVLRQADNGASIGVGGAGAVRFRVPAGELEVRTVKAVCGQRSVHTVFEGLCGHAALAAVGVKGHSVLLAAVGKAGLVGGIFGDLSKCGCPAGKDVGIVLPACFDRRIVAGHLVILHFRGVDHCTVLVLPGDGVLSDFPYEHRSEICIAGNCGCGSDLLVGLFVHPVIEGVGILDFSFLCGSSDSILFSQLQNIGAVSCRRELGSNVAIGSVPDHIVIPGGGGVLCSVSHIAGDRGDGRCPAFEGEVLLVGGFLGGRRAVILGHYAIRHIHIGLQNSAVFILPNNRIGVDGSVVLGHVGHIAFDSGNLRAPALEGVGVLGVSGLSGRCAVVLRHCAVRNGLIGLQSRAVRIDPFYRVFSEGGVIGSRVGGISGNRGDRGRPAGKGVVILRG